MAEVTGALTLRGAAQHAGVSINTMRTWAQNIPETKRLDDGSYQISKDALLEFLRSKDTSSRGGSRQGANSREGHAPLAPDYRSKFIDHLEGERDRLLEHLGGAQQRIKELEAQYNKLVTSFENQHEKMLNLTNTLTTLAQQLQLPEPRQHAEPKIDSYSEGTIIDAEHEHHEVSAAPKAAAVKKKVTKAKAVKKKVAKAKGKTVLKKITPKAKKNTLKKKTKKR